MEDFQTDTNLGLEVARSRLREAPENNDALVALEHTRLSR